MTQVLVLNQDYQAFQVCGVRAAFVLVLLEKAELVAHHPRRRLHSASNSFPLPVVIRLRHYVQLPYRRVPLTRQNVYRRDGYRCVYCGSPKHLTLDHLLPRARGGPNSWKNLVTACQPCNSTKGDRTPEEAGLTLRQRPFQPGFFMFLQRYNGDLQEAWRPYLYH